MAEPTPVIDWGDDGWQTIVMYWGRRAIDWIFAALIAMFVFPVVSLLYGAFGYSTNAQIAVPVWIYVACGVGALIMLLATITRLGTPGITRFPLVLFVVGGLIAWSMSRYGPWPAIHIGLIFGLLVAMYFIGSRLRYAGGGSVVWTVLVFIVIFAMMGLGTLADFLPHTSAWTLKLEVISLGMFFSTVASFVLIVLITGVGGAFFGFEAVVSADDITTFKTQTSRLFRTLVMFSCWENVTLFLIGVLAPYVSLPYLHLTLMLLMIVVMAWLSLGASSETAMYGVAVIASISLVAAIAVPMSDFLEEIGIWTYAMPVGIATILFTTAYFLWDWKYTGLLRVMLIGVGVAFVIWAVLLGTADTVWGQKWALKLPAALVPTELEKQEATLTKTLKKIETAELKTGSVAKNIRSANKELDDFVSARQEPPPDRLEQLKKQLKVDEEVLRNNRDEIAQGKKDEVLKEEFRQLRNLRTRLETIKTEVSGYSATNRPGYEVHGRWGQQMLKIQQELLAKNNAHLAGAQEGLREFDRVMEKIQEVLGTKK